RGLRAIRGDVDFAEAAGEAKMLLAGQGLLPDKEQHRMFIQRRPDHGNVTFGKRLSHIDTADSGADAASDLFELHHTPPWRRPLALVVYSATLPSIPIGRSAMNVVRCITRRLS